MRTKIFITIATILLCQTTTFAQNTIKATAIKANDYGVRYTLPKTSISITFEITKTVDQKGMLNSYAKHFLGINPEVNETRTTFTISNVETKNRGIADNNSSYMVYFRQKSAEPFLMLTKDGLICSINAEDTPRIETEDDDNNITRRVAINEDDNRNTPLMLMSEEMIVAGNQAKQAELIARQILQLRQNRNDILTGEADNMPPDGQAYKLVLENIDKQEKALCEMFLGKRKKETFTETITFIPEDKDVENHVIARFSTALGLLEADNYAGEPIYLSLNGINQKDRKELTDKEKKEIEKKFSEGVVYNIPGKALLSINFNNSELSKKQIDVIQFGEKDVLTKRMFDNLKKPIKVYFYPELGALKQIIQ